MADTPADTSSIATGLTQPQSASVDGQSATARSMADLVLGVQFTAAAVGVTQRHRGMRFTRLIGAAQLPIHPGPTAYLGGGGCWG